MQIFFTVLVCSLYDRYNGEDWSIFLLAEIIRLVLTIFNLLSILQNFNLFFKYFYVTIWCLLVWWIHVLNFIYLYYYYYFNINSIKFICTFNFGDQVFSTKNNKLTLITHWSLSCKICNRSATYPHASLSFTD